MEVTDRDYRFPIHLRQAFQTKRAGFRLLDLEALATELYQQWESDLGSRNLPDNSAPSQFAIMESCHLYYISIPTVQGQMPEIPFPLFTVGRRRIANVSDSFVLLQFFLNRVQSEKSAHHTVNQTQG